MELCGVNTARLPMLTSEEKDTLFERIKSGDQQARELYIKGNLRLVLSVIKRFSASNENADDLFQIGCIGLMKAIDNFDTGLGVKFSTYAVPMILGRSAAICGQQFDPGFPLSSGYGVQSDLCPGKLHEKKSAEPTICEIAQEIGIAREDIVFAMDAIQSPVSLYDPVYTEGGDTLYVMDQISDKKNKEDNWVESIALEESMKCLDEREKHIVHLRFFEGRTQMEVADEIGISQAQVSRLEKNALKAMRQYLRTE